MTNESKKSETAIENSKDELVARIKKSIVKEFGAEIMQATEKERWARIVNEVQFDFLNEAENEIREEAENKIHEKLKARLREIIVDEPPTETMHNVWEQVEAGTRDIRIYKRFKTKWSEKGRAEVEKRFKASNDELPDSLYIDLFNLSENSDL